VYIISSTKKVCECSARQACLIERESSLFSLRLWVTVGKHGSWRLVGVACVAKGNVYVAEDGCLSSGMWRALFCRC
jgi:hypothetical protein